MATRDSNINTEIKMFNFLWKWSEEFQEFGNKFYQYHKRLLLKGEIQISTMVENVMAFNSGGLYVKDSGDGKDFSDDSDAKTCTVINNGSEKNGARFTGRVAGIGAKEGTLRVLCYNRFLDKFYFFKIPYDAYKHLTHAKYGSIDIGFNIHTKEISDTGKWYQYRVSSFDELCK
jgi:hypothetical protein